MSKIIKLKSLDLLPKGFPTREVFLFDYTYLVPKYIFSATGKTNDLHSHWVVRYNGYKKNFGVKSDLDVGKQLDIAISYLASIYVGNVCKSTLGKVKSNLAKSNTRRVVNGLTIPVMSGINLIKFIRSDMYSFSLYVNGYSGKMKSKSFHMGNVDTINQERIDKALLLAKAYREKILNNYTCPKTRKF